MKVNKKVIESAMVAGFALVVSVMAVATGNVNTKAEQYTDEIVVNEDELLEATKEKAEIDVVASAEVAEEKIEETKIEETKIEEAEPVVEVIPQETVIPEAEAVEQEVSEWAARLMPNVEEYLNIRAEANEDGEVVGKLYKGAAADILEQGEEWSKVSSGSVEGYVKNEYCVFNTEAEAMANEQGTVYATSLTEGLRVRAEASAAEETEIVDVLEKEEKIKVDTEAEAPEGWVAVKCSDRTAYVSAEFVSVELELGQAISIEEELAAMRAEEEAKKAAQAAQTTTPSISQREAAAASYDDVTLLAALIQCEAAGECYEGKVAVGAVVINRLRNGYAGSIAGIIYQSGQFSPVSNGALDRALVNGVSGECILAAQQAISGFDNVGGALNFRRASSGQPGIVIGNHVFY